MITTEKIEITEENIDEIFFLFDNNWKMLLKRIGDVFKPSHVWALPIV